MNSKTKIKAKRVECRVTINRLTCIIPAMISVLFFLSCGSDGGSQPESEPISTLLDSALYRQSDHLISPSALSELLENNIPFTLIDVRAPEVYAEGHLPGAVQIWRPDYQNPDYPYGGMRASKEQLEELLSGIGARRDELIVLYDQWGNVNAARVWWMLHFYGHDKLAILNGGLPGWKSLGFEVNQEMPWVDSSNYVFNAQENQGLLSDKEEVLAAIEDPGVIILDVRKPDEYSGERIKRGAFRGGHIPGAILLDYVETIFSGNDQDHSFRSLDTLTRMMNRHGIDKEKKIIVYCQSGVRSAHMTFVLRELLHYPEVSNYDGSWVEWSYFENLPVVQTVEPVN